MDTFVKASLNWVVCKRKTWNWIIINSNYDNTFFTLFNLLFSNL